MKYALHEIEAGDYEEWNNLVAQSEEGTLFHQTYFYESLPDHIKIYLIKKNKQPIIGFITSYTIRKGEAINTRPPFVPYIGLVDFNKNSTPATYYWDIKKAYSLLVERLKTNFNKISLRLAPEINDVQYFIWNGFIPGVRYTYRVPILDLKHTWQNFDGNRRRNINKTLKSNPVILHNQSLTENIELFRATQNLPKKWMDYLSSIERNERLKKCSNVILLTDEDGVKLAGVYIVWDQNRSYYILGGFNKEAPGATQSYTSLALWEAMKFTKNVLGLDEFDLEGSMIPGVEEFFRKFGGQKVPYFTLHYHKKSHLMQNVVKIVKRII